MQSQSYILLRLPVNILRGFFDFFFSQNKSRQKYLLQQIRLSVRPTFFFFLPAFWHHVDPKTVHENMKDFPIRFF